MRGTMQTLANFLSPTKQVSMASKCMLLIIAITVAIILSIASATQYMVGDDQGWGLKVNYTEWAQGKEFFVGDSLVFMYPPTSHNVLNVTGPAFKACKAQEGAAAPLNTGNDVVTLATPGKKWYICGVEGHCDSGMKFLITVKDLSPAASPPQSSAAVATMISYFTLLAAVLFGVLLNAF